MYGQIDARANSQAESGPPLSLKCSISTEASVGERELIYDNLHSLEPSISSFDFSYPAPSPDFQEIGLLYSKSTLIWSFNFLANSLRNTRRRESCPQEVLSQGRLQPASDLRRFERINSFACVRSLFCFAKCRFLSLPIFVSLSKFPTSNRIFCSEFIFPETLALQDNNAEQQFKQFIVSISNTESFRPQTATKLQHPPIFGPCHGRLRGQPIWFLRQKRRQRSQHFPPHQSLIIIHKNRASNTATCNPSFQRQGFPLSVLLRKKRERIAISIDPLHAIDWMNLSPRISETAEESETSGQQIICLNKLKKVQTYPPSGPPQQTFSSPKSKNMRSARKSSIGIVNKRLLKPNKDGKKQNYRRPNNLCKKWVDFIYCLLSFIS